MKEEEKKNPGLASQYGHSTKRVINSDGNFNVKRLSGLKGLRDFYQNLVRCSWSRFLLYVFTGYVLINLFFAVIYVALGIENLSGGGPKTGADALLHAFYFSCQTFTTVGYGAISPSGVAASVIASLEALVGLLAFAVVTGLVYGRFSLPNARIAFSESAIVGPYAKGGKALMFRVANMRDTTMMDMEARVTLVLQRQGSKNSAVRDFHRLELEINAINFFPLPWTIVHPVDEQSPLFGLSKEELIERGAEILIQIKGFDDTFGQIVYQSFSYAAEEIELGKKFVRNFHPDDEGDIIVDLSKLSATQTA